MGVNVLMGDRCRVENRFPQGEKSPYLPPKRRWLLERFVRLRFRIVYHVWKRVILRYEQNCRNSGRPICILDVGCGPGNFLCCLEHWFTNADIKGLDVNTHLLKYAKKRVNRAGLIEGSAQQLPVASESFDIISALQVIEHLEQPCSLIAEAWRVLKPGGLFLMATPNPRSIAARLLGTKWQGYRYDHISLRTSEYWRHILIRSGFEILSEGTTMLNGLPIIGRFPFGLPLQMLQAIFGWFPWFWGESYMVATRKTDFDIKSGSIVC